MALAGAILGGAAGIFLLGQAAGGLMSLEEFVPGLLTVAFSVFAIWGCYLIPINPKRALRPLLGSLVGGLIIAGLLFLPAALALAGSAYLTWRVRQ